MWIAAVTLGSVAAMAAETVAPQMLLLDVAHAGPTIIAVGERDTVLRSDDQAAHWRPSPSGTLATLTGVSFADAQRGWAVGHDAIILHTRDGGASWAKQWQGENLADSFLDVLAIDADHVIAIGAYGLFVRSADGGKTWSRKKIIEDDYHLNRISRGPAGTLYIAGEHGTLLRSTDAGENWSAIAAPYDGSFYGVLPLDERTLLAHGLRGRVYRSIDDGATWLQVATPEPVLLATAIKTKTGAIILGGQLRDLVISRDGGRTFTRVGRPLPGAVAELTELADGRLLTLGEAGAQIEPAPTAAP